MVERQSHEFHVSTSSVDMDGVGVLEPIDNNSLPSSLAIPGNEFIETSECLGGVNDFGPSFILFNIAKNSGYSPSPHEYRNRARVGF